MIGIGCGVCFGYFVLLVGVGLCLVWFCMLFVFVSGRLYWFFLGVFLDSWCLFSFSHVCLVWLWGWGWVLILAVIGGVRVFCLLGGIDMLEVFWEIRFFVEVFHCLWLCSWFF